MAAISRLLLFILAAIPLTIYLTDSWIPSCFVFEPSRLQEICKKQIAVHGNDIKPLMKDLVLDLQKEYGPIVEDYDDARWVFNVAGGSTVCSVLRPTCPTTYRRTSRKLRKLSELRTLRFRAIRKHCAHNRASLTQLYRAA